MVNITTFDLLITWVGVSTAIWLLDLSRLVTIKLPKFNLNLFFLLMEIIFICTTMVYIVYRIYMPSGINTYLYALDNIVGAILLLSICLIAALYLIYPFIKIVLRFLPHEIANEIAISNHLPRNMIGRILVFILLFVMFIIMISLGNNLKLYMYGTCTETWMTCTQFSIFTKSFSNFLNKSFSINVVVAQMLTIFGALASMLGVIKTGQDIWKNFNAGLNNQNYAKNEKGKSKK